MKCPSISYAPNGFLMIKVSERTITKINTVDESLEAQRPLLSDGHVTVGLGCYVTVVFIVTAAPPTVLGEV